MLHVHDLVDYVSEESVIAGLAAAKYIRGESTSDCEITLSTDGKVRYTVPQVITRLEDTTVYFRVSDIFRDKKVTVRSGDRVLYSKKKQKLAPGEMETVKLTADMLRSVETGAVSISLED